MANKMEDGKIAGLRGFSREFGLPLHNSRVVLAPAIVTSLEHYDPILIERIKRRQKPDGYIYGPGAGNIFTMLETFPEQTPPKGLIMTDIDPAVVLAGAVFINGLKQCRSWRDFAINILFTPNHKSQIKKVSENPNYGFLRKNVESEKRFESAMRSFRIDLAGYPEFETALIQRPDEFIELPFKNNVAIQDNLRPFIAMARFYPLLRQLSIEDNIIMIYADMLDPDLLSRISDIKDLRQHRNVIYVSNIAGYSVHITRFTKGESLARESVSDLNKRFRNLQVLNPTLPNRNIYVQVIPTTAGELMAQTEIPSYTVDDFKRLI